VPDQHYLENGETLNLDIANLKSTALNADLSQEARDAAWSQLRALPTGATIIAARTPASD